MIHSVSALGWGSFCVNHQLVVLLSCSGSPGCFYSGIQVVWIFGSGVPHLPLDSKDSTLPTWLLNQVFVPLVAAKGCWESGTSISIKARQQNEAWNNIKLLTELQKPWYSGSSLTLKATQILSLSMTPSHSGTWIFKWNEKKTPLTLLSNLGSFFSSCCKARQLYL